MTETEKGKADRHEKRREKARLEREKRADTPEAIAERAKAAKAYDNDILRQLGERTGVYQ